MFTTFFFKIFYLKAGVQSLKVPGNDLSLCCDTKTTLRPFRGKTQSALQGVVVPPASPPPCGRGTAALWEHCGAPESAKETQHREVPNVIVFCFFKLRLDDMAGRGSD